MLQRSNGSGVHQYIHCSERNCVWIFHLTDYNHRETPNFERIVRWIHTIDGGSHPLPKRMSSKLRASDYGVHSLTVVVVSPLTSLTINCEPEAGRKQCFLHCQMY